MYTAQQLDDMRHHPDRQGLLDAALVAHDALTHPTPTWREVIAHIRGGYLEVLFDGTLPPLGGLTPGDTPIILGALGILGNVATTTDQLHGRMMSMVHEGVHYLDVTSGRCLPGTAATVGQRFFTELHAYTAEFELAITNGLQRHLHPAFWGARNLIDVAIAVTIIVAGLITGLLQNPGLEQTVIQRVNGMFPNIP